MKVPRFPVYLVFNLMFDSTWICCRHNLVIVGSKATSFADAMSEGPLSPVVALIAFFSIWSVAGLAGFHTYLTGVNMTTNEDVSALCMNGLDVSISNIYLNC